jgi:hypothetical protein
VISIPKTSNGTPTDIAFEVVSPVPKYKAPPFEFDSKVGKMPTSELVGSIKGTV